MKNVKCFDVTNMVIEEANTHFFPLYTLNHECVKVLQQYCKTIDLLAVNYDGEFYDVEVDEIKMAVKIILGCHYISITNTPHPLLQLVQRSKLFRVYIATDRLIHVEFTFPSLWESARKEGI